MLRIVERSKFYDFLTLVSFFLSHLEAWKIPSFTFIELSACAVFPPLVFLLLIFFKKENSKQK